MDITERKHAEEEREKLHQLEADLAHINRVNMMGELAAALAHEIKQPIAASITSANACLRWLARDPRTWKGRAPQQLEVSKRATVRPMSSTIYGPSTKNARSLNERGSMSERLLEKWPLCSEPKRLGTL